MISVKIGKMFGMVFGIEYIYRLVVIIIFLVLRMLFVSGFRKVVNMEN